MAEDPVQSAMGDFGRFQLGNVVMTFIYKVPLAWHTMAYIFLSPKVNFTCATENIIDACSPECTKRLFDDSVFTRTIISEWDLVCDRHYLASLSQSIVMLGVLIGSLIFGTLADKFGRRIPLFGTILLVLVSGTATAFIPWFWLYNVVRFINALAVGGGLINSYVSMMEIIGKPLRETLGITYQIPHWFGHLTLPAFGYFLRDWRDYQLVYSLASAIVLPSLCIIYESPRWLYSTGRIEDAAKVLTTAAKKNNLPTEGIEQSLQVAYNEKHENVRPKKANIWDLFRTRNLRIKTICISYNWFVCGMGYYGITQYAGYLGGDVFVNVALSATLEIPATIICVFMTKYWGRKLTMIITNLLTGFSMLIIAFLPENDSDGVTWIIIILVSIGIAGMSMAFANVYLFSGELFPTVVRNVGLGVGSMMGRVGAIIAPFVAIISQRWLSSLIFGLIPIVASILCIFLPETKGHPLPETIEDGENFGKRKK